NTCLLGTLILSSILDGFPRFWTLNFGLTRPTAAYLLLPVSDLPTSNASFSPNSPPISLKVGAVNSDPFLTIPSIHSMINLFLAQYSLNSRKSSL
ncbi:hypothetical protein DFH08DRAFT_866744, partial [Mycena albidolilacea]